MSIQPFRGRGGHRLAPDGPGADGAGPAGAGTDAGVGREGSREKLEKIKDLYLTVEAIGDNNVGKHFDELMQRQRELISDYFKETGMAAARAGRPSRTRAARTDRAPRRPRVRTRASPTADDPRRASRPAAPRPS